jgi:PAS domain-containing protein
MPTKEPVVSRGHGGVPRRRLTRDRGKQAAVAEQVGLASLASLGLLVDGMQDHAILGLDPDGVVTSWNVKAERIKGYRADEIIGRNASIFHSPAKLAVGVAAAEFVAAEADGSIRAEGWRVRKDSCNSGERGDYSPVP